MSPFSSRLRQRAYALILMAVTSLGVVATASPAQAAMSYQAQVVTEASRHRGAPYQWGAEGPTRFDCSGYTRYVFARFGKSLPHNAASQYASVRHIAKNRMIIGDLIFFLNSSGRISHVAIYAGGLTMWHSPHSGTVVKHVAIYSSNYLVGRP